MNRRELLITSVGSALGVHVGGLPAGPQDDAQDIRASFPRLASETFLNAAGGTPLNTRSAAGLRTFEEAWLRGPAEGRWRAVQTLVESARTGFAELIGAKPGEVGLVHCTKAGEQIVLDGLPRLRSGGNVVTNDLHFSGSLHNLVGLKKAGLDVRIVRSTEWDVPLEAMEAAIDDDTVLVAVTHVSNVNGRIEPLAELSAVAHSRGALVYADIIQSAGIVPVDVRALGVDFAACSGYKWLFGPHGAGFLFVREEHQGELLVDRLFPGHVRHNYAPWTARPDADREEFEYHAPEDARRYQPGHVSYVGYCALQGGLELIREVGVERGLRHALDLTARLRGALDPQRYECISPHADRSPIVTFRTADPARAIERLQAASITIAVAGDRLRVSPAIYNDVADIDRLVEALNG